MVMYADDSTVYASASTVEELEDVLNKELKLIMEWVTENRLALNIEKTKSIVLGSKYRLKSAPILNVSIGDKCIEQKTEVKLIGLIIDDRMSWNSYIDQRVIKMGRGMAVVRQCKKFISNYLIKQLTQALVLSHLDYGVVIWSNTTQSNLHKLQVTQNKATHIVLNCPYRTSSTLMHNQLIWLNVKVSYTTHFYPS